MWVTTGVRWSGMTTTSSPLPSVKCATSGPEAKAGRTHSAAASIAIRVIATASVRLGAGFLELAFKSRYGLGIAVSGCHGALGGAWWDIVALQYEIPKKPGPKWIPAFRDRPAPAESRVILRRQSSVTLHH